MLMYFQILKCKISQIGEKNIFWIKKYDFQKFNLINLNKSHRQIRTVSYFARYKPDTVTTEL